MEDGCRGFVGPVPLPLLMRYDVRQHLADLAYVSVAHVHPEARAWFSRRTSHVDDWPAERLLKAKGDARVSVVLPALNEEATVARIVSRIRRDLRERVALVDELVVMDSGSTDRTIDVAAAAGASVFRREDVLSELPVREGK